MYKIIFILLFVSFIDANSNVTADDTSDYLLPGNFEVDNYNIILDVNFDEKKNFTYTGQVTIKFQFFNDTKIIRYHQENLKIKEYKLSREGKNIDSNNLNSIEDNKKNFTTISYKDDSYFKNGNFTLEFQYEGQLRDDLSGFYKSYYRNDKKEKVWLALTQFEAAHARKAFPCFDEPKYKATFDLWITHPHTYTAISNTNVKTTEYDEKEKTNTTRFETTPRMSTYLLAFVISDFKNKTETSKVRDRDVTFSMYSQPGKIDQVDLAMKYSHKLLEKLELFTNVSYEFSKLDQLAATHFAPGAMENWGLVIYMESLMLFDEKTSNSWEKFGIVSTMAHEFAHQWFGNLVSPKSWNYLWLNEGFATFFSNLIFQEVEPKWRVADFSVVTDIQQNALHYDSSNASQPINRNITRTEDIMGFQTTIVYSKSAAVIRMMQHFLTPEVFQKSIRKYLNKFNHSSVDSDDLFETIQEIVDEKGKDFLPDTVKNIMKNWVEKSGYPIVTVSRNYIDNKVELKQERFLKDYVNVTVPQNMSYEYYIPINYATANDLNFDDTTPKTWLKGNSISIQVDPKDWVLLNKQQTGFYRVNYDEKNWQLLINYLNTENRQKIHALNRAQLMNDALALCQESRLSFQLFINLMSTYKNETDVIAWYPGLISIKWLEDQLINSQYYPKFKRFVIDTTKELVKIAEYENKTEDIITELIQDTVSERVCFAGHEKCLQKMKVKFEEWLKNNNTNMHSGLKNNVLCYGLKTSTEEEWMKVFYMVRDKNIPTDEKHIFERALACKTDKNTMKFYLNYTLNDNSTLSFDSAVFNYCDQGGQDELNFIIDFVFDYIIHIIYKYELQKEMPSAILREIARKIKTEEIFNKFKQRVETFPDDLKTNSIEVASKNAQWLKDNKGHLDAWSVNSGKIFRESFGVITLSILLAFYTNKS